ncbi:MAG: hypothetical protein Kow00108_06120 [Calditrichia bacterium]
MKIVIKWIPLVLIMSMIYSGCTLVGVKKKQRFSRIEDQWVKVTVPVENVRNKPNGRIIGQMKKGDSLLVDQNFGNWLEFNYKGKNAYIWGPSCGFPYINLYNPYTYLDTIKKAILNISELKRLLGTKVDTVGGSVNLLQLEFVNLGMGERVEEVVEVVKVEKQKVEKGVQIWYNVAEDKVTEVYIDLLKPVYGEKQALKKAGLQSSFPVYKKDETQVVFKLFDDKDVFLILKRKEWKSSVFIGYKIAYRY